MTIDERLEAMAAKAEKIANNFKQEAEIGRAARTIPVKTLEYLELTYAIAALFSKVLRAGKEQP